MMLKHKFILPENTIYLCGHSLGPLPYSAQVKLQQTIAHWGLSGVKAWNSHNWIELSQTVGAKIASLVGANSNEVTVCDSTSVNLYKALKCALNINRTRHVILSTTDIFPADLYVAQGVVAFDPNIALKMVSISELENNLTSDIAVLILSHVNYRDASVLNLKKSPKWLMTKAFW